MSLTNNFYFFFSSCHDRDASWELEPNAFSELAVQNRECQARVCLCSDGRDFDGGEKVRRFELMMCEYCGSHCVHRHCVDLKISTYVCFDCRPTNSDSENSFVIDITGNNYSQGDQNQSLSNNNGHFNRINHEISDDYRDYSQITNLTLSQWLEMNTPQVIEVDCEDDEMNKRREPCMIIDLTEED